MPNPADAKIRLVYPGEGALSPDPCNPDTQTYRHSNFDANRHCNEAIKAYSYPIFGGYRRWRTVSAHRDSRAVGANVYRDKRAVDASAHRNRRCFDASAYPDTEVSAYRYKGRWWIDPALCRRTRLPNP